MEINLPDEMLRRLSEFIASAMGLHFPKPRWPDLRRGLIATTVDLGFKDPMLCAQNLISGPLSQRQLDVLASHLTVGETYFFREPRSFEAFTGTIVPELIRQRKNDQRRIRIWSAACCSGEEAYTIAILLRRAIPDLDDWNVTILATDINPRFLRKGEAGIYGPWSFRNTPEWFKQSYFRPTLDGQLEVLPEIKRLVRFANLNLVEDGYPSLSNGTNAMDVIFCRNVLMYFNTDQVAKVVEKLHRSQMPDGWLLVSATELSQMAYPQYHAVNFPGATIYRSGVEQSQFAVKPHAMPDSIRVPVPGVVERPKTQCPPIRRKETAVVDPASLDLLARSLANDGKLTEARASCDQWIARDKLNAPAHYLLAVILQEQGLVDEAIVALRAANYLDPNLVLAHFALGNLARRRGRKVEADKHLKISLRLSARYRDDQVLPESDGITAGRFAQMIRSLTDSEAVV